MRAIEQTLGIRSSFFFRLLAFVGMLAVAFAFRADTPTEWDSWGYAANAVSGHSAGVGLGRWWFVVAIRWSYQVGEALFGLTPLNGFVAMQIASALMMAAALVTLMAWTYRLTKSSTAELVVAALVLPGPVLGLYASAVMTESMALLLITTAFLAWECAVARGGGQARSRSFALANKGWFWSLISGLIFGIAIDVREPAALFGAWPIISCFVDQPPGRWKMLSVAVAGAATTLIIGLVGAWAWSSPADGYWAGVLQWAAYMVSERQRYPLSIFDNSLFFAAASLAAMPIAAALLPSTIVWAAVRRSRLSWLILATTPYLIANLMNHDLTITGRYAIPFIWLLSPVVAAATQDLTGQSPARWRAAIIAIAVAGCIIIAVSWPTIRETHFDDVESKKRVLQTLLSLPEHGDAKPVIVAGTATPVVSFLNQTGIRNFEMIPGGWAWPQGRAAEIIAGHLRRGAEVYVNVEGSNPTGLILARDDRESKELMEAASKYEWDRRTWPLVRLLPTVTKPSGQ